MPEIKARAAGREASIVSIHFAAPEMHGNFVFKIFLKWGIPAQR